MSTSTSDAEQLELPANSTHADPLWAAALNQASRAVASVKADVGRRQEVLALLARLERAMATGNVDAAARVLADQRAASIADAYPELRTPLERIRLAMQGASTGRVDALLAQVEKYAKARDWPTRRVEGGLRVGHLLEVKPTDNGSTKVQAKSVRSLNWDAVQPVLDAEYERLWGRSGRLGADRIARELVQAINEVRDEASGAGHVRLRSVYNRMKAMRPKQAGRVASYYRDEFSADLSTVKQGESTSRQFEFAAARDPNLAFEVVEADGNLLRYGYIRRK